MTTQDDIVYGLLIGEINIDRVRPMEFVISRVFQQECQRGPERQSSANSCLS